MAQSLRAADEPASQSVSLRLAGGPHAPRIGRQFVLAHMELYGLGSPQTTDAGLIVSELVTNSVRHARVGSDELMTVGLTMLSDRLRITVSDSGSEFEPRLRDAREGQSGGFGLQLVEQLALDWGVTHDPPGTTQVWCELGLVTADSAHKRSPL